MKNKKLFISSTFATTFLCIPTLAYSAWVLNESKSKNYDIQGSDQKNTKPVAYIDGQEGIKYTSIEKALENAKQDTSANTIYVIPGTNPTIKRNCEIAQEDTLVMPYEGTTWQDETKKTVKNDLFADGNLSSVNSNRKNLIKIDSGVTLTNNGTLLVGGILGTSQNKSHQRPTGHTVGSYVELRMADNSTISNFGEITCYGYIKPENYYSIDDANQPIIKTSGANASITLPLVIYDYRGAAFSLSAAYHETTMPFNIFDFPNSQVKMSFENLSKLDTTITLEAQNIIQTETLNLIGTDGSIFKNNDGIIQMKYKPSTNNFQNGEYFTVNDSATTTTAENFNITQVNIFGNFEFSSTNLNLAGVIKIDTSEFNLPFSYKFHINIVDGNSSINSKLKFLKGSELIVSKEATLNINSETAFYSEYVDEATTAEQLYPRDVEKAILLNNGNVNINSNLSGFIDTNLENATLNISDGLDLKTSVQELLTGSGSFRQTYTYFYINGTAFGNISNNIDYSNPQLASFVSGQKYTSNSDGIRYGQLGESEISETKSAVQSGSGIFACLNKDSQIFTNKGIKSINQIALNDLVLSFNHFTGKLEYKKVLLKIKHKRNKFTSIILNFYEGSKIEILNSHGLFCVEDNKYISINSDNAFTYINKHFYSIENGDIKSVQLKDVQINQKTTCAYALITDKNFNVIANNLLTVTDVTSSLYNAYPYTPNTCIYDNDFILNFSKTHPLLNYSLFKNVISFKIFRAFNVNYLNYLYYNGEFSQEVVQYYLEILKEYAIKGEVEFCTFM